MSKGRVRLAYSLLAAVLAAPLALGVKAQDAQAPPPAPAQQPAPAPAAPADQQTPVFRSDINFVRVDVIVTDRQGNPVHDLKQEDFEVTEDGKPQAIQTFKLINVSEDTGVGIDPPREVRNPIDEQMEAARDDVRLFAIFLDDYHVRLENSMRAREILARFAENSFNPKDIVSIMYPLWSINDVILNRNRKALATALREFTGRKYDYTPRNAFEERYVHYVSTIEAERIRNQVTLTAIKGLIIKLGGLGRKAQGHRARQRGLHECAARAGERSDCDLQRRRVRQPAAAADRSDWRREFTGGAAAGIAGVFPAVGDDVGHQDGDRPGEPLQLRDLQPGSARPCAVRVRPQHCRAGGRQPDQGPADARTRRSTRSGFSRTKPTGAPSSTATTSIAGSSRSSATRAPITCSATRRQ